MSGFVGVCHFDGRLADRESISAMGEAVARKGPDGGSDWCAGSLGMSYRAFHTTHESHFERQPMAGPRGLMLCWDGRLDNREELQEWLGKDTPRTDAGLALAAYGKWGEEFAGRLVGDFALALYDPRERQVLLARDFFGARPLYYLRSGETLVWSTDLLPLMQHSKVDLVLDEHYIAQYLLTSVETHRTPYANIRAVEPGHVMLFAEGKLRKNEWHWKPDLNKEVRYREDREYEEHFYQLFRQSVKARLRSDGRPVWSDLSGGLDSSSIVCMADDILRKEGAECPRLDTWTAVNGESTLTNELPWVRAAEKQRGRTGFHLREDSLWFQGISHFDEPIMAPTGLLCIPNRFRILQQEMDRAGARILLSGHGGDHLMWKTSELSPLLADLLRGGHGIEFHRQAQRWSRARKMPYWLVVWRYGVAGALPESWTWYMRPKRKALRFLANQRLAKQYARAPWLADDPFGFRKISGRLQSRMLQSAIRYVAPEAFPAFLRAEVRHPFLHRPLVEFLFAIPHSQKHRPEESRTLMRRAFRRLLPPEILKRESKGSVDEAICRGLNAALEDVASVLERPQAEEHNLIDRPALRLAVNDVVHGGRTNRGDLLRAIALDLFLSSVPGTGFQATHPGGARNEALTTK